MLAIEVRKPIITDREKVAGTAGTPAEPAAKNTLKIKFNFVSHVRLLAELQIIFSMSEL